MPGSSSWWQATSKGAATALGTQAFCARHNLVNNAKNFIFPTTSVLSDKLTVSRLGVGSASQDRYGANVPAMKQLRDIKTAVEKQASNFIQVPIEYKSDKSTMYSLAIKELLENESNNNIKREELVLSAVLEPSSVTQWTPELIATEIDSVLSAMSVEVLDLVLLRIESNSTSSNNLLEGLRTLVKSGKVMNIGVAGTLNPDVISSFPEVQSFQFPLNLQEPEYFNSSVSSSSTKLIERPLHTLYNKKPLHLLSYPDPLDGHSVASELQNAFGFALKLEKRYVEEVLQIPDVELPPASSVGWANILMHQGQSFESVPEWDFVYNNRICPLLVKTMGAFTDSGNREVKEFGFVYNLAIRTLCKAMGDSIQLIANDQATYLIEEFDKRFDFGDNNNDGTTTLEDRALAFALSSMNDSVVLTDTTTLDRTSLLQRPLLGQTGSTKPFEPILS